MSRVFLVVGIVALMLGGCGEKVGGGGVAGTQAGVIAEKVPELSDVLAELGKAHGEKVQLAWYVNSPLRNVDPPFRPFYEKMGVEQKALLAELKGWAKANDVKLAFKFTDDAYGRARKKMEDVQGAKARKSPKEEFQRDMLMHMYHDYWWQICLIDAVLPRVKDAGLRSYLEKSKKVHEAGVKEIEVLMGGYGWKG